MRVVLVALVACSAHSEPAAPPPPPPPTPAAAAPAKAPPADARRWFAGDLHMHVSPPDDNDVMLSAADIARRAHEAKLDFVVLTPHVWSWPNPPFAKAWRQLAAEARATK